jgi:hypothetical protein
MVLPIAISFLIEDYGYRGTILLASALSLHGIPGGLLFQPVEKHLIKVPIKNIDEHRRKMLFLKNNKPKKENPSFWERLSSAMDLKLLKSISFLNIIFGLGFFYMVNINFAMLLPFYLKVS